MKAESDFYNIISACELKGAFLSTFVAASILFTQYKYYQLCSEEVPTLVRAQIEQVLKKTVDEGLDEGRIEDIKIKYYTCLDSLGIRAINLTGALTFFFMRRPRMSPPKDTEDENWMV